MLKEGGRPRKAVAVESVHWFVPVPFPGRHTPAVGLALATIPFTGNDLPP